MEEEGEQDSHYDILAEGALQPVSRTMKIRGNLYFIKYFYLYITLYKL